MGEETPGGPEILDDNADNYHDYPHLGTVLADSIGAEEMAEAITEILSKKTNYFTEEELALIQKAEEEIQDPKSGSPSLSAMLIDTHFPITFTY